MGSEVAVAEPAAIVVQQRHGVWALQLGFVALVIGSTVLLVALGYPAAAVVEAVVGAGLAAVEMIRRLRRLG